MKWTDWHTGQMRALLARGCSNREVADILRCGESTVRRWAAVHGLRRAVEPKQVTPELAPMPRHQVTVIRTSQYTRRVYRRLSGEVAA